MSSAMERLLVEWECAPWAVRWVVELMIECRLETEARDAAG